MQESMKIRAFADFQGIDHEDAKSKQIVGESDRFTDGSAEWLVLTDEEADEQAKAYIADSLWAFNSSFIREQAGLPYEAEEMIAGFCEAKCEGANETIAVLIDLDSFTEAAISSDGRGHFLSSYDGDEHEVDVFGNTVYIYRLH